jgi:prepilin-type N-terminal cleavage/methylation domain-containing protein
MTVSSKSGAGERQLQRVSRGFTLIELLIVVAIILIIAAIAIPNFMRSRMAANEAAAAETVRTVTTASVVYWTTYDNGYPPTLAAMGGVGAGTCDQSNLIDPIVTTAPNQKSGYAFFYSGFNPNATAGPTCSNPGFLNYVISATPIRVGVTGNRSFCSDTPAVVHFDPTGVLINTIAACDALSPLQ